MESNLGTGIRARVVAAVTIAALVTTIVGLMARPLIPVIAPPGSVAALIADAFASDLIGFGLALMVIGLLAGWRGERQKTDLDTEARQHLIDERQLEIVDQQRAVHARQQEERRALIAALAAVRSEAREFEALWGAASRQMRELAELPAVHDTFRSMLTDFGEQLEKRMESAHYAEGFIDGRRRRDGGGDPPRRLRPVD